ncbi:MAG: hypothetical protein ACR2HP_16645 [Ilumatobacteraceae bacterium]
MRITIHIDDDGTVSTAPQPDSTTTATPALDDLVARAQATGASSGGPAPSAPPDAASPPFASEEPGRTTIEADPTRDAGATSAGPAPAGPAGT